MNAPAETARRLTTLFDSVFGSLAELVDSTSALLAAHTVTCADLAALDPLAIAAVEAGGELVVGAGYVAAPTALADAKYWLQWWSDYDTPRTGRAQRLSVELDPAGESFRDYTELPWFAVPAETGERHVAGPYVDYLCTDQYTLTFAQPVFARGEFAGIVGADIYAQSIERIASPFLASVRAPAALLNKAGRVVAATRSTYITGDLVEDQAVVRALRAPDPRVTVDGNSLHGLPRLPFTLVTGRAATLT